MLMTATPQNVSGISHAARRSFRCAAAPPCEKNLAMRRVSLAVLAVVLLVHPALGQRASKQTIFVFHSDEFWLNLHHFLYVLGRAENKTRDSSRTAVVKAPNDQQQGVGETWRSGTCGVA